METGTAVLIGAVALGAGYLILTKNKGATANVDPSTGLPTLLDGSSVAPQATAPANRTSGAQGGLDSLYTAGGGIAGGIVGAYFGGPVGAAAGAKVGTVVGKPVGQVTQRQLTTQLKSTVTAVKGVGGGVADIAKGNVVGGVSKVVTNSVKAGLAPVTSTISALRSLW